MKRDRQKDIKIYIYVRDLYVSKKTCIYAKRPIYAHSHTRYGGCSFTYESWIVDMWNHWWDMTHVAVCCRVTIRCVYITHIVCCSAIIRSYISHVYAGMWYISHDAYIYLTMHIYILRCIYISHDAYTSHMSRMSYAHTRMQIGCHRISRLFPKLLQLIRILPMGCTISTTQYMVLMTNPMRNVGTPGTKLKVFGNNLKIVCHPICNRLYHIRDMPRIR